MYTLRNVNWGRKSRLFLWVLIAILAVNAGRLAYKHFRLVRVRAASPVAFTVFRTEEVFDSAGMLRFAHHYVEAVRSDGSTMWRGTTNDAQRREIYLANGDLVTTNELAGRKSTYPKKYPGPPSTRDPKANCATAQELGSRWTEGGEEMIGGHRAVRRVMNTGGGRTLTMWYGIDLGCALIQQRLDHETGVSVQKLAAFIPGEPDTALFQVSASFNEVPPSALVDCKTGCTPLPDDFKQKLDKSYYALRSNSGGQ